MSKLNIELIINDQNITNSGINVVNNTSDMIQNQLIIYVGSVILLFSVFLLWLWYTRKKRREDPIWEEENEQYNTFQFGTMTILMVFIILSMVLGVIAFMNISLFGKATNEIVLFAFFLSVITLAIRVITIENTKFEKAKETVHSRRGLYTLLMGIQDLNNETFDNTDKEKIQELATQYIDILRTEKFASTIRKENQQIYSTLLLNLTRASLKGSAEDIINAVANITELLSSKSFSILK